MVACACLPLATTMFIFLKAKVNAKYLKKLTRIKYENVIHNPLLAVAFSTSEYNEILAKLGARMAISCWRWLTHRLARINLETTFEYVWGALTFIIFQEYSYKSVWGCCSLLFWAPSSPWTEGYPEMKELLIGSLEIIISNLLIYYSDYINYKCIFIIKTNCYSPWDPVFLAFKILY